MAIQTSAVSRIYNDVELNATFSRYDELLSQQFDDWETVDLCVLSIQESILNLQKYFSETIFTASIKKQLNDNSYNLVSLYKSRFSQFKTVVLHRGQSIPLHDHPNASGFTLVLQGAILLDQFTAVPGSNSDFVGLINYKTQHLVANTFSMFLPVISNVHQIKALENVVLLSYQYSGDGLQPSRHLHVIDTDKQGVPQLARIFQQNKLKALKQMVTLMILKNGSQALIRSL